MNLQSVTEDTLRALVTDRKATPEQVNDWIIIRNWSDEDFNSWLLKTYPEGQVYREPQFWNDKRFNNPMQPVVGVSWFEARAYCNWLTATAGMEGGVFRLPTEVEFEAAVRGKAAREYPYGRKFDQARCNTFESHIRRTTPVGIFDNATPEGAYDLSGNAFTWTSTIYDEERFQYPWRRDEREDPGVAEARRLVRGGSWDGAQDFARAAFRGYYHPADRDVGLGVRVVFGLRPPSLNH
ncbi:MAG: hypothetical protein EBU88_13705 [Acidobacteria bacterium]|nr:hypothetical protein [Acidobacteriota bacterium]